MNFEESAKLDELRSEQLKLGMEPRHDSVLSMLYAQGNVPDELKNVKVVAKELKIVDHIYKHTNYSNIIEDVMREIAHHIHFKYRIEWDTTWDIVRFYVPDMLKLYSVKKYGIKINDIF